MKKAFDANVSKAKPRLRLGASVQEPSDEAAAKPVDVEALARQVADEPLSAGLSQVVQARAAARTERPSAVESLRQALSLAPPRPSAGGAVATGLERPVLSQAPPATVAPPRGAASAPDVETVRAPPEPEPTTGGSRAASAHEARHAVRASSVAVATLAAVAAPVETAARAAFAAAEVRPVAPPEPATVARHAGAVSDFDVQDAAPLGVAAHGHAAHALAPDELSPAARRERLKQRLRSVRENPRPDPLPETVAEAGVFAVERIATLQSELTKARAVNLALAQDLEATRRQAERATEEARVRMDEARRLSEELEGRAKLLSELEGELKALESERDEVILAVQEARQALQRLETDKGGLQEALAQKDRELIDSLAEEERLAGELEAAQDTTASLRRSSEALKTECDMLSRQVADLMRERVELLEARKALEAVHRALSKAAMA